MPPGPPTLMWRLISGLSYALPKKDLHCGRPWKSASVAARALRRTARRFSYFFLAEDFFFEDDFFPLLEADFLRGTLAPSFRACDSAIAIACLRLFTFLPDLPLFKVPLLRSCITFSTFLPAFFPYFAMFRSMPGHLIGRAAHDRPVEFRLQTHYRIIR